MNTGGAASPVGADAARSEARRTSRDPEPSRRSPRDLPRPVGPTMALGAVVALAGFAAVALNRWPGLAATFEPRIVSHVGKGGTAEAVVQRNRSGHYVVCGSRDEKEDLRCTNTC